ncbi:MAG: hypothetical protein IJ802_03815 [Kiritimatiellae bacterium]|nr:hypothetical protein [Kiritimatiellia bacterium]
MDERSFTISVPQMDAAATNTIAKALAYYSGVRKDTIRFDLERREVALVYDSMLVAEKNLEFAIAEKGFAANGVTPASIGK